MVGKPWFPDGWETLVSWQPLGKKNRQKKRMVGKKTLVSLFVC